MRVPDLRITAANDHPVRQDGEYVLYWMIAQRRTTWNYALDRAIVAATKLDKPLVIFEALRCDYEWNCDRLHAFVIAGMRANAARLAKSPVTYYPYIEPKRGAGRGLLAALAKRACVVITDEFPCIFVPRMVAAAAKQIGVRLETIDGNGIVPLRAPDRAFPRAYSFRTFFQKQCREFLEQFPAADPLKGLKLPKLGALPAEVAKRWPAPEPGLFNAEPAALAKLPINHDVPPAEMPGGADAAAKRLDHFLNEKLERYAEDRNEPAKDATSGLSPYLHFGHVSVHEVLHRIFAREDWSPEKLSAKSGGGKEGWWGLSEAAEGFLDELITWREVGYNMAFMRPDDYDRYESLPDWARETLAEHADDPREHTYSLEQFEAAETHDKLWNAAQMQLRTEGRIHNYLRMLWGKKILHWSASPREALRIMIELNNKYALDGRNPNSYSGIFWVLGRYDRAWGPEREIFGKIRYMTSDNTARKFDVKPYVARYLEPGLFG